MKVFDVKIQYIQIDQTNQFFFYILMIMYMLLQKSSKIMSKFKSSARFQTDELFRRRQQTRAAIINATKEFLKSHFSLGGVKMVQL